jgi:hypothetical protein
MVFGSQSSLLIWEQPAIKFLDRGFDLFLRAVFAAPAGPRGDFDLRKHKSPVVSRTLTPVSDPFADFRKNNVADDNHLG